MFEVGVLVFAFVAMGVMLYRVGRGEPPKALPRGKPRFVHEAEQVRRKTYDLPLSRMGKGEPTTTVTNDNDARKGGDGGGD